MALFTCEGYVLNLHVLQSHLTAHTLPESHVACNSILPDIGLPAASSARPNTLNPDRAWQALAAASEKVGSLSAHAAALQAEQAAHLAWTGRSFVLASLSTMEVRLDSI